MGSDANVFEDDVRSFKEFVDNDGRHFYIIQFEDDSGRVFRKQPSEDNHSIAEFSLRSQYAKEAMRKIASATDFEIDENANTQQNLRKLMKDK